LAGLKLDITRGRRAATVVGFIEGETLLGSLKLTFGVFDAGICDVMRARQ